ncbi:SDR family oxidoreductase [Nocardioides sp. GCM10027113]|uniref:SDR family oxidoreductase n=1 Tax=unclassified Nocardioides TaxID=2615069 RepID=UPI00360AA927
MSARVAVVGGSGKTGRAVSAALADLGASPRPLGRADWADLAGAVAGCDAAYVIAPNLHPDEPAYVSEVLEALRAAGVPRVVLHSVASPYAPDMPHHLGKARAEDLVRRSGLVWAVLQPGAYLRNLPLDGSPMTVAYRADAPFGFAHLPDLGEAAARVLLGLLDGEHDGATYELASLRATVAEVAAAAGAEVQVVSPEEWAATAGAALEPRERDWLRAMFDYYDRHGLPVGTLPMAALLGRPPTGLGQAVRPGP